MTPTHQTILFLASALFLPSIGHAADGGSSNSENGLKPMKIQIRIADQKLFGTIRNGATARDFVSLLPLKVSLRDYAGTEKIADLPRKLITQGDPAGSDPSIGDIAYYAPWGNLAIYYKDFGYSDGLVILGKLEGNIESLKKFGGEAVIERVE